MFAFPRPDFIISRSAPWLAIPLLLVFSLLVSGCSIPGFSDDDGLSEPSAPLEQSEPESEPADTESPAPGELQQQVPDEAFQIDTDGDADLGPEPVEIVEGGIQEPRTLNPVLVDDPLAEELSGLVFSGLTRIDPNTGDAAPDLAEDWEVNEDATAYSFTIREDATWHDGQPVTAQDVEFTFELIMDFRTRSPRYSRVVERITAVEALDTRTVEVRLISPYSPFLSTIATFGIVPQHILINVQPDELVAHPFGVSSAVGTGPFEFAFWTRGDQIVFEANRQHFRQSPQFDRYIYRVAPDAETLLEQIDQQMIDWARINPDLYDDVDDLSDVELVSMPGYEMISVVLQLDIGQTATFQEADVRRALMFALDRDALVEQIWRGHADVAHGTVPPASWAATEPQTLYDYDPEQARQILDNAGWGVGEDGIRQRDGQPLQFDLVANGDNQVRREIAEWLVEQWREIGIDAGVTFETWGDVRDRITNTREFDALLFGYRWDIDPDQHPVWSSDSISNAFNLGSYVNEDVDRLLDTALTSVDQNSRRNNYAEVQEIVLQDLPALPLVFPNQLVAIGPRLHDNDPTAILLRNRGNVASWMPE